MARQSWPTPQSRAFSLSPSVPFRKFRSSHLYAFIWPMIGSIALRRRSGARFRARVSGRRCRLMSTSVCVVSTPCPRYPCSTTQPSGHCPRQACNLGLLAVECMAVIGISGQGLHAHDEIAGLRRRHTDVGANSYGLWALPLPRHSTSGAWTL